MIRPDIPAVSVWEHSVLVWLFSITTHPCIQPVHRSSSPMWNFCSVLSFSPWSLKTWASKSSFSPPHTQSHLPFFLLSWVQTYWPRNPFHLCKVLLLSIISVAWGQTGSEVRVPCFLSQLHLLPGHVTLAFPPPSPSSTISWFPLRTKWPLENTRLCAPDRHPKVQLLFYFLVLSSLPDQPVKSVSPKHPPYYPA